MNSYLSGYQNQDCQVILNNIPAALLVIAENKTIFANNAVLHLLRAHQLTDLIGLFLSDISPTTQPDILNVQNLLT